MGRVMPVGHKVLRRGYAAIVFLPTAYNAPLTDLNAL